MLHPKDADGMANSVDPDQSAAVGAVIWVYTVFTDLSIRIFRIITFNFRSGGKYGFVDKVIDGIFVHINSVTVQFNSQKFEANLQVRFTFMSTRSAYSLTHRSLKPVFR